MPVWRLTVGAVVDELQLAMLAYNLNCWLMLFNREEEAKVDTLGHTTLATARLKFLFLAARIWSHAGRVGSLSGQRSYIAARILSQHGFRVRNLTGAYRTWRITQPK